MPNDISTTASWSNEPMTHFDPIATVQGWFVEPRTRGTDFRQRPKEAVHIEDDPLPIRYLARYEGYRRSTHALTGKVGGKRGMYAE